jgi:collagenase-like PrtC family protease
LVTSAISNTSASDAVLERPRITLPELLAPAGDWNCARAAVENGADAIYFGLEKFNARMRAHNFTSSDLPKLMEFLHRRGVKGYVTFNTLVFQNDAEAKEYLKAIIAAGVDAAIIQDVGICRLIRRLSPDFPIHVSTQMTITSAAGVALRVSWDATWWCSLANARSKKSSRSARRRSHSCHSKFLFMEHYAWPIPGNASRARLLAAALLTAANAHRRAGCLTSSLPTVSPYLSATASTC